MRRSNRLVTKTVTSLPQKKHNDSDSENSSTEDESDSSSETNKYFRKKPKINTKPNLLTKKPNLSALKSNSSDCIKDINLSSSSSSDEESPVKPVPKKSLKLDLNNSKPAAVTKKSRPPKDEDSSSESDIENYLKSPEELNRFSSSFFEIKRFDKISGFDAIEEKILNGVVKTGEKASSSDSEAENAIANSSQRSNKEDVEVSRLNFQKLNDYARKLEEAKRVVERYENKKIEANRKSSMKSRKKDEEEINISNLLAVGEAKCSETSADSLSASAYFEDSVFSDSEKEEWEEIEENKEVRNDEVVIPKEGLQVSVNLPGDEVRKKKKKSELDILASIKRRLNRKRKENQILVHKVHLLCWLAHGNHVNVILNRDSVKSLALSLIPNDFFSQSSVDLDYLKKFLNWYKKTIPLEENKNQSCMHLKDLLKLEINLKKASNHKTHAYIFISLLRSLGIQCRLVISFQVAPLRPPENELHSLSMKDLKLTKEQQKVGETSTNANVSGTKQKTSPKKEVSKDKEKSCESTTKQPSSKSLSVDNVNEKPKKAPSKKKANELQENGNKNTKSPRKKDTKSANAESKNSVASNKKTNLRSASVSKLKETSEKLKLPEKKRKTKSTSELKLAVTNNNNNESPIQSKRKLRSSVKISQVDGADDDDSDDDDSDVEDCTPSDKPNLKKLSQEQKSTCPIKNHPKRLIKTKPVYVEATNSSSENDVFEPPKKKRSTTLPNLKALKSRNPKSETTKHVDDKNTIPSIRIQPCTPTRPEVAATEKSGIKDSTSKAGKSNKRPVSRKSSDTDYAPSMTKKKSEDDFSPTRKVNVRTKQDKKEPKSIVNGVDIWVEVFSDVERKWIPIDLINGQLNCPNEIVVQASQPVSYIVAWNNDNCVKDVTSRYCTTFNTVTRKLRIDRNWWEEALNPFLGNLTVQDKEEDEQLAKSQLDKPLPTAISQYKNHPLYALKRHLLQFEAFYPPNPISLGFIRNEPVYSRDCVKLLHSRENWLKEARVVKPGEKAYKVVLRPKYDKIRREILKQQPLDIFGEWQTEEYVPPAAENGIVPKNEYGNVELYKLSMLPKGTVHLQLPNLHKVARKMNIDVAPAMIGFESNGGWPHPMFDGYVVCEEHSDILVAGWYAEQEDREKREQEKLEKRVYDNWKRLIKGLLIRERLNARYNFGSTSESKSSNEKKRSKKQTKGVNKKRKINESDSDDA